MSYCRFSSDNYMSDVYAFEGLDGTYHIYVAQNKLLFPPIPSIYGSRLSNSILKWSEAFLCRETRKIVYPKKWKAIIHKAYYIFISHPLQYLHNLTLNTIPRKNIGLCYDGESFTLNSKEDFFDKLLELRGLGYNVPDEAVERIIAQMDNEEALSHFGW